MRPRVSFVVSAGDPRERLDKLVGARLERAGHRATRGAVQRWIRAGDVTVDGARGRASQGVRVGAVVEVEAEAPVLSAAAPDPSVRVDVVYEDDDLLVVDKPAGLVVHPARGHAAGTLVQGLLARGTFRFEAPEARRDPRAPARGAGEANDAEAGREAAGDEARDHDDAHVRPGIVHRLDKGTSGLLVVAKNDAAREGLKALFQAHDIEREYVAIVEGAVGPTTFDTLHGRHPADRLRFTTRVARGKRAITHVRSLETFAHASLVACTLETGRTHQIRVHLAERANAPILGDPLYGRPPKDRELAAIARELGHQALHARTLGFAHPRTGERLRFESPPPIDFQAALARLRRAR